MAEKAPVLMEPDPNWVANLPLATNLSARTEFARKKFARLRDEWKSRKSHSACVEEAILHPAYLRIIGIGPDAIPLILAELESKTDHWFCALYALTEADPVPEDDYGNMEKMVQAWLKWGRTQGYSW